MRRAAVILAAVALSVLAGCTKWDAECRLVVQPYVMASAGSDPRTPAYMARVYAWYITEREEMDESWAPGSFADAEAGIVRHRDTGEVRPFGLAAEQNAAGGDQGDRYMHLVLTRSPVVLVVVDPVNKFYGWRPFAFDLPLRAPLYLPVTFRVYNGAAAYEENKWHIAGLAAEQDAQEKR